MVTTYTNAGGTKDSPQATSSFTISDWTSKYTLDCNTDNAEAIADVLGQVILELIRKGILTGTVATT